jgi:signal peptidase I
MNLNSIMETLANLAWWQVAIIVAILLAIRFGLAKQEGHFAKSVAETAESLAVAMALVFFIIRPFIIQAFYIPSASMHPTLLESDHILVNKFLYRFREPRLGDVVVFKAPPNADPARKQRDFIKRVIAVPGDTVRITPGSVLVGCDEYNHKALREILEGLSKVEIRDRRVYEDGKPVPNWEISQLVTQQFGGQFGPQPVRVETDEATGESEVVVGPRDYPIKTYGEYDLPDLLQNRHSIKLIGNSIYRDGRKVDPAKLAELVGRPGAKVKVIPGVVYLNGRPLKESYTAEDPDADSFGIYPDGPGVLVDRDWIVVDKQGRHMVKIPKGKLLVMGDNRNQSNDARHWGLLDRDRILGKAMVIFWPILRIRIVH